SKPTAGISKTWTMVRDELDARQPSREPKPCLRKWYRPVLGEAVYDTAQLGVPPPGASVPRKLRVKKQEWHGTFSKTLPQIVQQRSPIRRNLVFAVVVGRAKAGIEKQDVNRRTTKIAAERLW